MKIKKYVARNMPEALQQVREDLGDEAVILNTRQIRRNNRFNPHDEARVEVTAAFDESASPSSVEAEEARTQAAPLAAQKYAVQSEPGVQPEPWGEVKPRSQPPPQPRIAPPVEDLQRGGEDNLRAVESGEVARELRHLREVVTRMDKRASAGIILPQALERLSDRMHSMGLAEELIGSVVQKILQGLDGEALDDRRLVAERAVALLVESLPKFKDIIKIGRRRKIIGFIGASGAGKTTAMAKIAAGFAMKRKDRIVLVTTDDKRVGALDQARTFAEIIGVPLEVAYDGEEVNAILKRYEAAQLVLIDTGGCGPHDLQAWEHQRQLLEVAGADEVQVVLDGLNSLDHMLDVIEASGIFAQRRLLFTKMDEVVRPGAVLSAAVRSGLPTSYLVAGSEVPGAIEVGDLAKLVEKMIGAAAVSSKREH